MAPITELVTRAQELQMEAVMNKENIEVCKWCYKFISVNDHKECKSTLKKTLRSRRQKLDSVTNSCNTVLLFAPKGSKE